MCSRDAFAEATMRSSHSRIINSILTRFHEDETTKVERRWVATRYEVELLTSIMILPWGYHTARAQGAAWAIITAILILRPGLDRSMSASGVFMGTRARQLFRLMRRAALEIEAEHMAEDYCDKNTGQKRGCLSHVRVSCLTCRALTAQNTPNELAK
jgi:hypothetical protein